MIASVRGRVVARGTDHVIVETGGVGYKVYVPRHPVGNDVLLHTHQVVREDGHLLFGFESREELTLFEMLIGVSGVGPRSALALLSVSRPPEIAAAIAARDAAALARAPGVGKKIAERLIVELRSKVTRLEPEAAAPGAVFIEDEAAMALQALGYSAAEAAAALRGVPAASTASTAERVTAALRRAAARAG